MTWNDDMKDPRLDCRYCLKFNGNRVPATKVAPQHTGGDVNEPATWVPICDVHFVGWYDQCDDSPPESPLPVFDLPLTDKVRSTDRREAAMDDTATRREALELFLQEPGHTICWYTRRIDGDSLVVIEAIAGGGRSHDRPFGKRVWWPTATTEAKLRRLS